MAVRRKYNQDIENDRWTSMKMMKRNEVKGGRKRQEAIARVEAEREPERMRIAEQRMNTLEAH
jgi:hypothetical protein